jgi:DNA-binding NarL/FixJ family response regulator
VDRESQLMQGDLLAIVEAAYAVAPTDVAWLRGVAQAALPVMQRGGGLHAYLVDLHATGAPLREPLVVGAPAHWGRAWRKTWWDPFMATMSRSHVRALHTFASVIHTTDLFAAISAEIPTYDEYLSQTAARHWGASSVLRGTRPAPQVGLFPDSFNVACVDGEGFGCALVANMPDVAPRPVSRQLARTWAMVAAHIATGYRLHRKIQSDSLLTNADLVLDARGSVVHATGPASDRWALASIRAIAASAARARTGAVRRDPARALEAWRALALGRWSILDCFDRDGRRYVVAQPNEPCPPRRPKLTRRQTQVVEQVALGHGNKLIAYELGLHPSTVATHLAEAAERLGARTRTELILLARGGS